MIFKSLNSLCKTYINNIYNSLTHCSLNELPHIIYLKILILIEVYQAIPREKRLNYLQTVETLIRCQDTAFSGI